MDENPRRDEQRFTADGEKVPPDDLLVGELQFGVTEDDIRQVAAERVNEKEGRIFEEDGVATILTELRKLYDAMCKFEAEGLRGDDLFLRVQNNPELLRISGRYYGFARGRIWGYRQQNVWFVR